MTLAAGIILPPIKGSSPGATPEAVFFDGGSILWRFPTMTDSPDFTMSVWVYVSASQLASGGYPPDGPPGGDLYDFFDAAMFANPSSGSGQTSLQPSGASSNVSIAQGNPTILTFTYAHNIAIGNFLLTAVSGLGGWIAFSTQTHVVSNVTTFTVTIAVDTSGFPVPSGVNAVKVYDASQLSLGTVGGANVFYGLMQKPLVPDGWVNLLLACNSSGGSTVFHMYYGETPVTVPFQQDSAPGSIGFSQAQSSETDSWTWGGTSILNEARATFNGIIAYIAELWFAPGQFIDLTVSGNRAKFHDGSNKPVSLGSNGSVPTGTPPVLYLHGDNTDPYTTLALPLRFVDPQFNGASTTSLTGVSGSPFLVVSVWIYAGGDHTIVSTSHSTIDLDIGGRLATVDLFDATLSKEFKFTFPLPALNDLTNVCFAVDTGHIVGSKIVLAYVNNVSQTVTVVTDNSNTWLIDWSNQGTITFAASGGFENELWFGPGQFFNPVDKFMTIGGAPANLGTDGSGANGTAPAVYLSCRGTDAASTYANNRGTGGTLTQQGSFRLVPQGATFLKNRAGGANLFLNSIWGTFNFAPTSPY